MHTPVIDAHAHLFPRDIPARWDWYAEKDPWFAALTRDTGKGVREAWVTPEETVALMDKAGVDRMVMQGWYWNDMDLCRRQNDFFARVLADFPGRFYAFASINPTFGAEALREAERCRAMGFSGIGELGPGGNGYPLDHPGLLDLLAAAEEWGLPVNFHVGEPVGHDYPGRDMTPLQGFFDLAKRFPNLKLVLAHLGGGLPFYELAPRVAKVFQYVWYDLAALPLLYRMRAAKAAADIVGPERILFGTDFPLTLYPRKGREAELERFLADLRENSGLTAAELDLVLGGNTETLLGGRA